jgi:uncharacterized protein (TIGR02996 family)
VALDAAMAAPAKPAYPKSLNSEGKQQRWLALAEQRREADLPALLALLHDGSSRDVEERALALREWGDDARIISAFVRLYEQPAHVTVSSTHLYDTLAFELGRVPDLRALQRLDALAAMGDTWVAMFRPHMRPVIREHLAKLRGELEERLDEAKLRPLSDAERSAVGSPPIDARVLLQAIYEAPDDDVPRRVYADWLLSQGDARGELITLQCERREPRRVAALLAAHKKEWLGVLAPVVVPQTAKFERGFPSEVELRFSALRQLSPVTGDPAWNTLRTLIVSSEALVPPLALLLHPAMKHVYELRGLQPADVRSIARAGSPVQYRKLTLDWDGNKKTLEALANRVVFPRLEALQLGFYGKAAGEALRAWSRAHPHLAVKLGRT